MSPLIQTLKKGEGASKIIFVQVLSSYLSSTSCGWLSWARSIEQNFRAEVRKFLGGEWIATGPEGLVPIPFHSQKDLKRRQIFAG